MGEMRFNSLGLSPNQFHTASPPSIDATKPSAKPSSGLHAGEAKDTLSLSKRFTVKADAGDGKVARLENPSQVIRLAVANDPRGGSLHPATLDRLKNPPKDASGFNI